MLPEDKSTFRDWSIQSELGQEYFDENIEYTDDDYYQDYIGYSYPYYID